MTRPAATGSPKGTGVPGAVGCVQSYGELVDWRLHVHLRVSWGVFRAEGTFVPVTEVPKVEELERLFRDSVLKVLLGEEAGRPPPATRAEPQVEPLLDDLPYQESTFDRLPIGYEAMGDTA